MHDISFICKKDTVATRMLVCDLFNNEIDCL